jgi:putative hydrolase of the HAD superfamily
VEAHFDHIFDIRVASYLPKPFAEPYLKVLEMLDAEPQSCVMIEDSLQNLETAKKLGMETIWVGEGEIPSYVDRRVSRAADVAACLGFV